MHLRQNPLRIASLSLPARLASRLPQASQNNDVGRTKLVASLLALLLSPFWLIGHPLLHAQDSAAAGREVRKRVAPEYPELARRMNLTGRVKVEVDIAADGHVISAHSLGGHPVLVQAAEKAVREWKFAPAADITTQVVVLEFAGSAPR